MMYLTGAALFGVGFGTAWLLRRPQTPVDALIMGQGVQWWHDRAVQYAEDVEATGKRLERAHDLLGHLLFGVQHLFQSLLSDRRIALPSDVQQMMQLIVQDVSDGDQHVTKH